MTVNGTQEQIKYLIEQGALPAMCQLLGVRDTQVSGSILLCDQHDLIMANINHFFQ